MSTTRVFTHSSIIPTTMERIIAFHNAKDALRKLTPPLLIMQCVRDERTSLTHGEVEFVLWFGLFPVRWLARHEAGPITTSFVDRMIQGPMDSWEHQHIFREIPGGVELTDQITLAHKAGLPGLFSRLIFDGIPLRILFLYRHWRTRRELAS